MCKIIYIKCKHIHKYTRTAGLFQAALTIVDRALQELGFECGAPISEQRSHWVLREVRLRLYHMVKPGGLTGILNT